MLRPSLYYCMYCLPGVQARSSRQEDCVLLKRLTKSVGVGLREGVRMDHF